MRFSDAVRARSGPLAAAALVIFWSSGFVGSELSARAGAAPLGLLAWRFVLLSLVLLGVWALRRARWPDLRAWRRQLVLGVLCQAAYLALVFEGVSHGVPGGTAALIAAMQPLLVSTVAGRLLGEHSNVRMWCGMGLGLLGVALVVSGDVGGQAAPWWAYALPVVGMVCLGGGTVLSRRIKPPEGLFETLMMQSVVAAVVLMAVALAVGDAAPPADVGFWRAVLWLMVLSSIGGYGSYVYVARTQGATVVSTLLYLTPPTTMLWVFLMFGEPVTRAGLVGLVVCGAGVALALRARPALPEARATEPMVQNRAATTSPDTSPSVSRSPSTPGAE